MLPEPDNHTEYSIVKLRMGLKDPRGDEVDTGPKQQIEKFSMMEQNLFWGSPGNT